MEPGVCRAIEYEIVGCRDAANMGLIPGDTFARFNTRQIAVLRCVDHRGEKLTALTDAERFRQLLASGEASDPQGMPLDRRDFPVVYPGWLQAS